MSKRYVLLVSDAELSDEDRSDLFSILEDRYRKVSVIAVERNPRAVIVKTTNSVAPLLWKTSSELRLGKKRLTAVLTSGSIGKLKSIASGSETTRDVKIPK